MAVEGCFGRHDEVVGHARADQGAPSTNAFRIDMGFIVAVTRILQGADETAGGGTSDAANGGACGRGREPASRNDRSESWNRQEAKTCQQTSDAAKDRARGRPARDVAMLVHIADLMVPMCVVGDDADIVMRHTGALQLMHCSLGIRVIVE
jgi:hypothetical protein